MGTTTGKRIKLRLSRTYDYGLCCLCLSLGKKAFTKAIKDILIAKANGGKYIPLEVKEWVTPEAGDKGAVIICSISFPNKNTKGAAYLERIPSGMQSIFLKSLVWGYYGNQIPEAFSKWTEGKQAETKVMKEKLEVNYKADDTKQEEYDSSFENPYTSKEPYKLEIPESTPKKSTGEPDFGALKDLFGDIKAF